uniref:Uncharacterized protein n=1 Tax=Oryza brachyantha TaxID=4533 RepID=J3N7C3_ORYBR
MYPVVARDQTIAATILRQGACAAPPKRRPTPPPPPPPAPSRRHGFAGDFTVLKKNSERHRIFLLPISWRKKINFLIQKDQRN